MTRTVFITGASTGIGLATALRFRREGWNVAASMRDLAAADPQLSEPGVLLLPLDVTDGPGIAVAVEAALAHFGGIDVLVNNAGYGQYGLFEAVPEAAVRTQFDVNVFGVMAMTRALLPHFRSKRAGAIVNVSSGAGLFTLPMISLYCASKFALEGFSEALAYEMAAIGVAVRLVIPHGGVSETRFHDTSLGRSAAPAIDDYGPFVARTAAAFAGMAANRMISADDVAARIFEAATDPGDRLRYLVGDDARGFVRARRELDEEDYIAFMRGQFMAG